MVENFENSIVRKDVVGGQHQLEPKTNKVVKVSPVKNFLAGGFGGMCITLVGHPMDTIKVRLQTQPIPLPGEKPLFTGLFDCLKKTVTNEGFRGLYKGMGTPFAFSTLLAAVSFWGYRVGRAAQGISEGTQLKLSQVFIAGIFSGALGSIVCVPTERIKCLLQIQRADPLNAKYAGPIDCAVQLYREQGLSKGLYRGTSATLLRDLPGMGIFFFTYEYCLRNLSSKGTRPSEYNPLLIMFSGGCAGVCSWFCTVPVDTLKSRLQTGSYPDGLRGVFRQLIREEGPAALYKGLAPVLLRAFPGCAASFLGYETGMKFLRWAAPDW